ncbi:MAG: hypothetical protein F9K23_17645 [Bacteroidetes bacterium]|nr:MAG: hypothetical protein F9K23_17645 [Bacteroidota bacterium]
MMDINRKYEEIIKFAHDAEYAKFTGADQATFEKLHRTLNRYTSTQNPDNNLIWEAGYIVGSVVAILKTAVDVISMRSEFVNQREYLRNIDSDLSGIEFNTNNQYSILEGIVNRIYNFITTP